MNKYIENFYNLHSQDDSKVYKAILEKKDWLFKPLYMKCSFEQSIDQNGKINYPYLYAIMDQCIPFSSFAPKKELFEGYEDKKDLIKEAFDKDFACAYLYDSKMIPLKKGEFLVELDFAKMDDKAYKELVANFFPCINTVKELDLFYDPSRIEDLLKYPFYGESGKWVFVLSKNALLNGRYYVPVFKKILYQQALLDDSQIEALEIVGERTGFKVEED